jgi:SAM-dependent methyltransferase
MQDSTERFSSRVDNYVRYRPTYPAAVIDLLREKCGLNAASTVADVGSGTGILTRLLLATGAEVFAVEPNAAMRDAAEQGLRDQPRFHSIAGTAESTTLADHAIDIATAGQAFHWFDPLRARAEFLRILRADGWVAIVYNERSPLNSEFLTAYEQLLRKHAPEYDKVNSRRTDSDALNTFFSGERWRLEAFPNHQLLDYGALEGRLLSSSYAPEAGHPEHAPMIAGLREIFARCNRDGRVLFDYRTFVYYGRISSSS